MNGATVKAYSLAKDGTKYLTKHFRVREFRCRDGSDPIFIAEGLPEVLEQIRSHFGKPATISSAYRTATHNKKEGGSTYSRHLYGAAADISVSGVPPLEVAKYADELLGNSGGVGDTDGIIYEAGNSARAPPRLIRFIFRFSARLME